MRKTYLVTHEYDGQISHSKFSTEREIEERAYWGDDCDDVEEIQDILDALSIDYVAADNETIIIELDDAPIIELE